MPTLNHHASNEKVDDDNEYRRIDDSLSRCPPYPLRTSLGVHSEIVSDRGDDKTEEQGLRQALNEIGVEDASIGSMKVGVHVKAEEGNCHKRSASDTDCIGEDCEEEKHNDSATYARSNELAYWIASKDAHRIDLIGDLHGPQLGGDARGVASGNHQPCDDGTKFLNLLTW